MKTFLILAYVCLSFQCVLCRDFYLGMFRRHDLLVAQDNLYKERKPYSFVRAEYGRHFKCPITYFRIVDRLGMRGGVTTTVVRGGLLKKYITVRLKSCYNCPISINIYVGCENVKTTKKPDSGEFSGSCESDEEDTTVGQGNTTTVSDTNSTSPEDVAGLNNTGMPENSTADPATSDADTTGSDAPTDPAA